jgi:KDO2-lipid IV(A) lauroyltransferase
VIQALPLSTCQALSRRLAWCLWHVVRLRRTVVEGNLAIAFPNADARQRQDLGTGMWEHLLLMIAEIAHAPRKVQRTNWRAHSAIPEMETLVRLLLDPRPTVLISGHLGNFEMGGYLLGLHGFPTHTIARPLDNPYLDRWVNSFRGATGQHMLPKDGSGQAIAALLEQGGTLVLLGDQFAHGHACWVDFFGKPAATHKAVAVFTLTSQAPTVTCGVLRDRGPLSFRMRIAHWVDPAAEDFRWGTIPLLTSWYTEGLETLIREAPEQYWWVHRRWKGTPPQRTRRRSSSIATHPSPDDSPSDRVGGRG